MIGLVVCAVTGIMAFSDLMGIIGASSGSRKAQGDKPLSLVLLHTHSWRAVCCLASGFWLLTWHAWATPHVLIKCTLYSIPFHSYPFFWLEFSHLYLCKT